MLESHFPLPYSMERVWSSTRISLAAGSAVSVLASPPFQRRSPTLATTQDKAKKAGILLAEILEKKIQGSRPCILVRPSFPSFLPFPFPSTSLTRSTPLYPGRLWPRSHNHFRSTSRAPSERAGLPCLQRCPHFPALLAQRRQMGQCKKRRRAPSRQLLLVERLAPSHQCQVGPPFYFLPLALVLLARPGLLQVLTKSCRT